MNLQVLENRNDGDNNFSLILQKPTGFNFYPGQYLDVKLPVDDPNGNTRAFTLSSSPSEDFLMITSKKGISPYKKFAECLKPEDEVTISHPAGTFILDESSPAVFIAGGIGITPFRSIIKYAYDQKLKTKITLFYSNSDEHFVFKDSLEKWGGKLPNLKIIYLNTSKTGYLNIEQIKKEVPDLVKPIFYLAGPPKMVDNFDQMLLNLKVDKVNIRTDRFDGY